MVSSSGCVAPMLFLDCSNASADTPGAECVRSCHALDVDCVSQLGGHGSAARGQGWGAVSPAPWCPRAEPDEPLMGVCLSTVQHALRVGLHLPRGAVGRWERGLCGRGGLPLPAQ